MNFLLPQDGARDSFESASRGLRLVALLTLFLTGGCASLSNPVADGVPVSMLPPELRGESREEKKTIPLHLLRQNTPETYRLAAGDVLGVYIQNVLGEKNLPPVHFSAQGNLPPALGYPIPIREDGTVSLPMVQPIQLKGMTLNEATDAIRNAYTGKEEIIQAGKERIIVTLMEPRRYNVLVIRQDSPERSTTLTQQPFTSGILSGNFDLTTTRKHGQGMSLELPAYQNDVLTALARTGGLPGNDAKNEVVIQRAKARRGPKGQIEWPTVFAPDSDGNTIKIPLRLAPGAPIAFKPEDVILEDGDIVFIEAREAEFFFTGGLLPSGVYPLPRDYDLDVVKAIAIARGPIVNGAFNQNNFTGQTQQQGIGFPNPSLVSVLRRVPGREQINIRVDLNKALRDPRERVLIQPGDIVVLQDTPGEALAQYFTTTFRLNIAGTFIRQRDASGAATYSGP
jgi:protein involved in polysaccharide export with SLBB domain